MKELTITPPRKNSRSTEPSLLIVLGGRLYVRNFVESGAFKGLAEQYKCAVVLGEGVDPAVLPAGLPCVGTTTMSLRRSRLNTFRMYLTMWAHRRRSTSYALKFNVDVGYRKLRYLYQILAWPLVFPVSLGVIDCLIGCNLAVEALLDKIRPALVIIPSQGVELLTVDVLSACRSRRIPTFMLINGWDNLSTKGTMPIQPDLLGVWGEESKEHAIRIQKIAPSKIRILGVPHFEGYREPVSSDRTAHIRAIHAITPGHKITIFAGCSRDVAELALLDELEHAIARGIISNRHIIYRPHPWGHATDLEIRFAKRQYRFISLDAQIKEGHERVDRLKLGRGPNHFTPDLSYYPALISCADSVISPLSTFLIEAAVMGKPALAIAFSMGKTEFPLELIYECEHFHYLRKTQAILTCRSEKEFIQDVLRLMALADRPDTRDLLQKDIAPIVSQNEKTYAERLVNAVQDQPVKSAAHG